MKNERLKEWGYWFGIASQASRGLFASSNFLENGVLINNSIKQELKQFLKSCDAGRKLQSSLENMLKDKGACEDVKNYQDVFFKIVGYGREIYTYLNAVDGLEKGYRGGKIILRDFYSRMLKHSSHKIYESSQNI